MRALGRVTLACIDTVNHALALRALALSRNRLQFARTLFLTDAIPSAVSVPEGIEVTPIEALASRDDYSRFVLKALLPHVATTHVLLVQWDGYVVNPESFDDAFLDTDYIGAKWYWYDDGMRVGNGGFSLRSRRLLQALQDPRITLDEAEDITICRSYRPLLERDHAIRFAGEELADRFAFEAAYPAGWPFGFHGLYNFCRVVPQPELARLAIGFSDAIARSLQLAQLLRNCIALGQWDAAVALARRRLAALPDDAETRSMLAHADAGVAQGPSTGRNDPCPCGSGRRYKQCHGTLRAGGVTGTESKPSPLGLAQQGLEAHQRGDIDAAERAYRAALQDDAENPLALHYLGVVQYQRGRYTEALPLLARAVALTPGEPEFHNNLGLALAAVDRDAEAIAAYRCALDLKPDHATAWNNLGLALQATNALPAAIRAYRNALERAPDLAQGHWNLALALLANGDYAEGWREYEWRLRIDELGGRANAARAPRWQGDDLQGRPLLVTAEQGLGDALQFVRYVAPLAERGVRVVVQAQPALRTLLATAPGVASVMAEGEAPPDCGAEIPLLSLPHVLRVGADEIAASGTVPYLRVGSTRRAQVAAQMAAHLAAADSAAHDVAAAAVGLTVRRTRNVGVAWAGASHNANDRRRSIPLAALTPLFAIPRFRWFSLQKGIAEEAIAKIPAASALVRLDARNDLDGTAALVDALDAVVSVDTSIAHLAGALGKPVFILLPFAPDWRWGISGTNTPWYRTARLLRQHAPGDWAGAVDALRDALQHL